MDWDKIAEASISGVIGLLGVGLGGFLTLWKERSTDRRKREKDLGYLATLVVAQLHELVEECIAVSYDDGTIDGRPAGKNDVHDITVKSPEFKPLELDVDWKVLPVDLMHQVLSLPLRITHLNRRVDYLFDAEGPPWFEAGFEARKEGFAQLGVEITLMMMKLRAAANLPPDRLHGEKASQWARLNHRLEHLQEHRGIRSAAEATPARP